MASDSIWRNGGFFALAGLMDEMPAEIGNVLQAVAQRRNFDRHDVQPIEEILAEIAFFDAALEIAIGRGDHADIHLLREAAADALEAAFLQHAQQFGLEGGGDFADFIEHERSAVGQFETAAAEFVGAGEGAFFVAEEFGFEKIFGEGRAIDGEHRAVFARGGEMDRPGDDFLAGAAFAADQDGGVAAGDHLDFLADLIHGGAVADQRARRTDFGHAAVGLIFQAKAAVFERAIDEQFDLVAVERLLNVIVRAQLHRLDGVGDGGECGHQNDGHVRAKALGLGEQFQAGHFRHPQIGDEKIEAGGAETGDGGGAVGGGDDLVSVAHENLRERIPHHVLIVNNEYSSHAFSLCFR